ncbi:MAG: hypothetical protein H6559_16000 [Lewinellaceae bacterium]|nr:hypothetical protein [Lewinellaceae bacterium]
MEIDGNGLKGVERGDTWRYMEIHGDTWKYMEMGGGDRWKYMEMGRNGRYMEIDGNGLGTLAVAWVYNCICLSRFESRYFGHRVMLN